MNKKKSKTEQFFVIQKDMYSPYISVDKIKAKDIDNAWEIVEEEFMTNSGSEWVLDKNEALRLFHLLGEKLEIKEAVIVKGLAPKVSK